MYRLSFYALMLASALISCGSGETNSEKAQLEDSGVISINPVADTVSTSDSGLRSLSLGEGWPQVQIKETHPAGMSLSNLDISFSDTSIAPLSLADVDPLDQILQGDLDQNGDPEFYLVLRSAGSASSATIKGYTLSKQKKLQPLSIPEIGENDIKKGGSFEGYMGHDSVWIESQNLRRQFPRYAAGDNNAQPSGGTALVVYSLKNQTLSIRKN